MLSKGSSFDPNAGNKYGVRRIHHAVTNGNYAEVENLVKAGAKINVASFDGFTPLGSATYKNDLKITKFLLNHGPSIAWANDGFNSPLISAVEHGNIKMVEVIFADEADANIRNRGRATHLMTAFEKNNTKMVDVVDYQSKKSPFPPPDFDHPV